MRSSERLSLAGFVEAVELNEPDKAGHVSSCDPCQTDRQEGKCPRRSSYSHVECCVVEEDRRRASSCRGSAEPAAGKLDGESKLISPLFQTCQQLLRLSTAQAS